MRLIKPLISSSGPTLLVAALAVITAGCSGGSGGDDGGGGMAGSGGAGGGGSSDPYTLTVVDGAGSGSYQEGEEVHVFARVNPYQSVVTGWTSSATAVGPSSEWHFVFTMPAQDVTLTPDMVDVAMTLSEIQIDGVANSKKVIYAVPPDPKGVVFTFHGTAGSADVIDKPSMQYLARLAFHRGYAVVSTEAEERTLNDAGPDGKMRWDSDPDLATNVDLQNIQLISDMLPLETDVPASGPRYAVGMSNGGSFAITVGTTLPFKAVTSHCSTGRVVAWKVTDTPTQWLMCENDTNESAAPKKDKWQDGNLDLIGRGIITDYDVLQPSPFFDTRFARIDGVDAAMSTAAVAELLAKGAIDESGVMLMPAAEVTAAYDADKAAWPAMDAMVQAGGYNRVRGEIKHAWADHNMFDDWAARTLDFLEAQ